MMLIVTANRENVAAATAICRRMKRGARVTARISARVGLRVVVAAVSVQARLRKSRCRGRVMSASSAARTT